jgi:hypothetical protein
MLQSGHLLQAYNSKLQKRYRYYCVCKGTLQIKKVIIDGALGKARECDICVSVE